MSDALNIAICIITFESELMLVIKFAELTL